MIHLITLDNGIKHPELFPTIPKVFSILQVTTKRESQYAAGPPFDAVSSVGRLQVVGEKNTSGNWNENVDLIGLWPIEQIYVRRLK